MNEIEAIKVLKSCHSWDCEDEPALDLAIQALEKQIPKKPTDLKSITFDGSINRNFKSGTCPTCGSYIDSDDDKYYCGEKDCGQAIDWSVEE